MARPPKQGLDYFPLDCQLDDKFELIEAEFGLTGFGVVVKLLQRIYGQNGYYIEWTDEVALLFAKRLGVGRGVVSEIVKASIRRGLFDKELFKKYSILTSAGIQNRYLEITKRRKDSAIKKEYLLADCAKNTQNDGNKNVNVSNNPVNVDINPQSKVKESKLNKSISGVLYPLINQEKDKLVDEFGAALTEKYIERTSNYHCCNYDTIRKWILEDKDKKPGSSNKFNDFPQREVTQEQMNDLEQMLLKRGH